MQSNKLNTLDDQAELPLMRRAPQAPVADEVIFAQASMTAAIRLAANVSGLEEKEIYLPLKIDASHWTRILNGQAHFPTDKLDQFCDIVGNEIVLAWWAHRRGKGLHILETKVRRMLRVQEEENERLARENTLLRQLVQGKAT